MKRNVCYLLIILTGILWVSCEKNEREPQPQMVEVSAVMLNKTTLSMIAGNSETLIATVVPENAMNKAVVWSSNNGAVATVDREGKVTALAAGTTTVTVITGDGGYTATCEITVTIESKYFVTFKYDNKDYRISNDKTCIFTKHSDSYYVINCSDAVTKQALTINLAKKIELGKSYDIYAGAMYVMSEIKLFFTAGEDIAEESFWTDDFTQGGVIGNLTILELTDEQLSGTFKCRTMHGEITEGLFYVKAKEWE